MEQTTPNSRPWTPDQVRGDVVESPSDVVAGQGDLVASLGCRGQVRGDMGQSGLTKGIGRQA